MACSYYITDRLRSSHPFLEQVQIAIDAGVDYIQIREKDLSSRKLFELAVSVRSLAQKGHSRILINDRLDIALAAELDGVHLGQESIRPEFVRLRVSRPDFLVGVSTHTLEELQRALKQGTSFVTFGPVFFTLSKAVYGQPVGLAKLKEACSLSKIPVFALGGINSQNFEDCLISGAAGIAGIHLFQDELSAVRKIRKEISSFTSRIRSIEE